MIRALAAALAVLALSASAAYGQAQLPAKPQVASLDSEAPPGAPPHWLPNEPWVMQHWLPYDEARLYKLLPASRGEVWRWLRDDTRTLAELARTKGWAPEQLARSLALPWRGQVSDKQLALLTRRALRTLTQGHLSQHIFFHSLHQNAIPDNAPKIFGVASREAFQAARRAELSPLQICRLHGLSATDTAQRAEATLRAMAARGVATHQIPQAQADRLLARQLRQLPRWLGQTRYNGPPPLNNPRASEATASDYSNNAALAASGKRVAYESYAASLAVAKTRGEINVLSRGLGDAEPALVSQPTDALVQTPHSSYNPAISADGRYVAYESAEGNLNFAKRYGQMAIFVRDTRRGTTVIASPPAAVGEVPRSAYNPTISGDGRVVAYESSESRYGHVEVWLTDMRSGRSWPLRPGVEGLGHAAEPSLSGDGNFVVFSAAVPGGGGTGIFRQDLRTGHTRLVSSGAGDAYEPVVSADGRYVAWTELIAGTRRSQVVLRDLRQPAGRAVAARPGGSASEPSISADGTAVAYTLRDLSATLSSVWVWTTAGAELVSRASGKQGPAAAGASEHPSISGDGRYVAFTSDAWNLAGAKCNAARGIFVRDRGRAATALVSVGDGANRFLGPTRGSSAAGDMTVALVCA